MSLKSLCRSGSCRVFYFLLNFALSCGGQPIKSDLVLGGIFSEHFPQPGGKSPCGEYNRHAAADRLAMEFAVSEINADEDILHDIRLGTDMKDTCSDLDYAVNATLDYDFVKDRYAKGFPQCAARETETKCCLNSTKHAPLIAIVAGGYSHVIKAIVNLVGVFKVIYFLVNFFHFILRGLDYSTICR